MLRICQMNEILIQILSILLLFTSGGVVNSHIIRTRLGAIEGLEKEARNGRPFYAYYGIPYAKPPVGRLRFEAPVEANAWSGTFKATEIPLRCPQIYLYIPANDSKSFGGDEDCLFIHVFTPSDAKPGKNLPVLFFICGGGFIEEGPSYYGPEFLMSRDIILVMVSYRLGALGFLSTGDDVIPGNMGLRDQAMAMKWTKENIYDFGGDPHRVTIQGHSAGSVCVHAHTISPSSQDYFDQAIMQSGLLTANGIWDRDYASAFSQDFGRLVNCPIESTKLLKICLQSRTAQELVLAEKKTYVWRTFPPSVFLPVIEDDSVTNAFLNRSHFYGPYPARRKPWLLGITTGETAYDVGEYYHPDSSSVNMDPKLLFPVSGRFHWSSKLNHVDFIVRWLKTRFFGEEEVRNTTDIADIALVKMLNGIFYGRPLIDVVQKYGGPQYVYLMDYRYVGGFTYSKGGRDGRYLGVAHADELPLIFSMHEIGVIAEEDFAFGEEMITRWVNFVHSGNPNRPFAINTSVFAAWAAVSSPRIEFLRITRRGNMEENYFLEEYDVWRKIPIFSKYFTE